jgi:uncharacterized protein YbbK (DUF523 family)
MAKAITQDEFIKRASIKHNNKYDYSKVNYKNAKTKVKIICPEHGEFLQTPFNHLRGSKCNLCSHRKTTEQAIEDFKKVHKDKYDYSKVQYKHHRKKVIIICPEHGEFLQTPNIHITGHGCPKCNAGGKYQKEKVLENFKKVHSETYDYTQVKYNNSETPVEIICKIHGSFYQIPHNHKSGSGCPKCASSKGEKIIANFLRNYLDTSNDSFISFSTQHKFQEAPAPINNYRFDFYIPEVNLVIEFDGIQHYELIDFAGKGPEWAKEEFLKNKKRDEEKNKYLLENNINLLRVPYTLSEYDIEICVKEEIRWLRM